MSGGREGHAARAIPAVPPVGDAGPVPPVGDAGPVPPVDPSILVESLARALAAIHDGTVDLAAAPGVSEVGPGSDRRLRSVSPDDVASAAERAVRGGWRPDSASPWAWMAPDRLVEVLRAGVSDVAARIGEPVPTIGAARIANLDLSGLGSVAGAAGCVAGAPADARRGIVAELSGSPNLVFRTSRRAAAGSAASVPGFLDLRHVATADPYRDVAVAAADVVASFGPGAVIGFMEAYASVRPAVEPIDPLRLDWWSLAASLPGLGPW